MTFAEPAPITDLIQVASQVRAATPDLQPAVDRASRLLVQMLLAQVDIDGLADRGAGIKARLAPLAGGISDRETMESACALGLDAKSMAAELKATALEDLKGAAYALHRELSALFGELEAPSKEVEQTIKGNIESFCSAEMRQHYLAELEAQADAYEAAVADRQREITALRRAGRVKEADALERMPVHNPYLPKPYAAEPVKGVSISVIGQQCVVVDATLVPEDLMKSVPDLDLIGARAAATGFSSPIPGVEFVPTYRIAFSARRQ